MTICAQPRFVYFWPLTFVLDERSFILCLEGSLLLASSLEVIPPLPELIPGTPRPLCGQPPEIGGQLRGHQHLPLRPQIVHSPPTLRPAPLKCSEKLNEQEQILLVINLPTHNWMLLSPD